MSPDLFYAELKKQPFQPIQLTLKDGRSFVIREPELVMVCESFLMVGLKPPSERRKVYHQAIDIPYSEMDRMEPLDNDPYREVPYNSASTAASV